MKKIEKKSLASIIVAFIVLIVVIWFFKDAICPKCFVLSNQDASVITITNYSSSSGSRGDMDSGGIVGTSRYPSVKVTTLSQLNSIFNSISFYNSAYRNNFYTIIKDSIDNGGYSDIYFDRIYDSETSIGKDSSSGQYVEDTIMTHSSSCSRSNSVQSYSNSSSYSKPEEDTPGINRSKDGICGLISIAQSLKYTLKAPIPSEFKKISTTTHYIIPEQKSSGSGAASGSGSNSGSGNGAKRPVLIYESWITLYLEWLARGVIRPDGRIAIDKYIEIYKKILGKNIEVSRFVFSIPPDKAEFDKLFKLFNSKKTDCIFITSWNENGKTLAHASHIRRIWYSWEDNSINIEMTNTLDQGDGSKGKWKNIPIDPGTITIKIKKNLNNPTISISVKSDKRPYSNKEKKEKNDRRIEDITIKQLEKTGGEYGFDIHCVTIKD